MGQIKKMTCKELGEKKNENTKIGARRLHQGKCAAHHVILKECYSLTIKSNRITFVGT